MSPETCDKYINFVKKTRFLSVSWVNPANLRLTYEGAYSLTPYEATAYMIRLMRLNLSKPLTECRILECFAGHGGDTIPLVNFGRVKSIVCFENNEIHRENLKHNVSLYFSDDRKVKISEDGNFVDYIQWINRRSTTDTNLYDIVYMDPPWGGQLYKSTKYVNDIIIHNSKDEIFSIVELVKLSLKISELVVLKLPPNFDLSKFKGFFTIKEYLYHKPDIKYVVMTNL